MADTSTWENPLMPNLRLRQIYVAMMQVRALEEAVPHRRGQRSTRGLEACLVSPTVDLGPTDLISDGISGGAIDYLRGAPAAGKKKLRLIAECGHAANLPASADSIERLWTAVGAAAALQSLAAKNPHQDAGAAQPGVTVIYLLPNEVPPALLKKVFRYARLKRLPLLFVVLPPAKPIVAAKTRCVGDLALSCGVPAIPTDVADAVALYRVTQESIGHARIGGGPAVIECVYVAMAGRRNAGSDAIAGLEQYMLPRKVVTQAWLNRETKTFARRIAKALTGS